MGKQNEIRTAKITVTQEFVEDASNSQINSLLDLLLNFEIKEIQENKNHNSTSIIIQGENLPDKTSLRIKFEDKQEEVETKV